MLFLTESIYNSRRSLAERLARGELTQERCYAQMVELEPADSIALCELGRLRQESGDLAGAEEYFWRAIDAQPCNWFPYLSLAQLLSKETDSQAISEGLAELAFRKLLLDDEALQDLGSTPMPLAFEGFDDLPRREQIALIAEAFGQRRNLELAAVTARLRPYRLIHELQGATDIDAQLVDALVESGEYTAPLLVGVLRCWAQDHLPDDDERTVENALAVLGEIGDASVIPHLLEFMGADSVDLSGAAHWAFDRILELHPEDAAPEAAGEPSPWTVYDICAGNAVWEDEEAEDGRDRKEQFPEPVRRKPTPGRNDPCWCGSGKKYKKCHLEADQQAEGSGAAGLRGEFDALRGRLGDFLAEALPKADKLLALEEFFGDDEAAENETLVLVDWIIHDWIPPRLGRPVMQEFLKRHSSSLTQRERAMVESWSRSCVRLYEVREVRVGKGVEVKDLISDEVFFVHDVSMSKQLVRWDGLLARVVEGERGIECTGAGVTVPRQQLEAMRTWIMDDRERSELSWAEYLKRNLPRIRHRSLELSAERVSSLQLCNSDGEELLFSRAVYSVLDEPALITALDACPEMTRDEDGGRYTWLSGSAGEEGRTVLGSIRIAGTELALECNSKKRHERGKRLLSGLAGSALRHLRDEFTTQQEMKRRMREEPRPAGPATEEIPHEVRQELLTKVMEQHFAKWPDMALPALGGMSPRQAVETAAGRRKVSLLLRDFENAEERKRKDGEPYYDIARLRAELDVEE